MRSTSPCSSLSGTTPTPTIKIANAGSVQPLFVSAEPDGNLSVRTIRAEGFPLGLFPHVTYEEFTLSTRPGDRLVFFSDGIVDAVDAEGAMYGEDRLRMLLESLPGSETDTAQSTVNTILNSVSAFQSGTAHFDDETVVVLRTL